MSVYILIGIISATIYIFMSDDRNEEFISIIIFTWPIVLVLSGSMFLSRLIISIPSSIVKIINNTKENKSK